MDKNQEPWRKVKRISSALKVSNRDIRRSVVVAVRIEKRWLPMGVLYTNPAYELRPGSVEFRSGKTIFSFPDIIYIPRITHFVFLYLLVLSSSYALPFTFLLHTKFVKKENSKKDHEKSIYFLLSVRQSVCGHE